MIVRCYKLISMYIMDPQHFDYAMQIKRKSPTLELVSVGLIILGSKIKMIFEGVKIGRRGRLVGICGVLLWVNGACEGGLMGCQNL